jgi:CubicO group peptidase (beta-lactamase class C family)
MNETLHRSTFGLVPLWCVVLALSSLPICASQSALPDSAAGRRFSELMSAMDSGDPVRLREWTRTALTPEMLRTGPNDPGIVGFLVDQQRDLGGFEVHRLLAGGPTQVEVLVRARKGTRRWLRYVVGVEEAPPHRVSGIFVFAAPPDAVPAEGAPLAPEEAARALEAAVEKLAAAGRFSGAVLLAKDGRPLVRRAWGVAERSFHAANRPDTLFGVASLGKMFTAVAVARLVEQGKVGWDDPVGRHVKGWMPEDAAAKVTIRHLLTHTSGLGDFLGALRDGDSWKLLDGVAAHRPLVAGSVVATSPGPEFRYSNSGYLVLGAVVEAVSGRDFYAFVKDEVFSRAGMPRSGYPRFDDVVENRAVGYLSPKDATAAGWRSNIALQGLRGTPAGGAWSTVDDLLAFAESVRSHRVLRKETVDALLSPQVKAPFGGSYGLGFEVDRAPGGGTVFGHAGGFPGVGALLRAYSPSGLTLVVLSNQSSGTGDVAGAWETILPRVR